MNNILYGKKLWEQLNVSPNAFSGIQRYGEPYVCSKCETIIKSTHTFLAEDGERICDKCHEKEGEYTSKW